MNKLVWAVLAVVVLGVGYYFYNDNVNAKMEAAATAAADEAAAAAAKVEEAIKIFEKNGESVYNIGTVRAKSSDEVTTTVIGKAGSWGYANDWIAKSSH